jgi:hypothetical protein
MPDLPCGTVTFLFTDIEGSTRLLQQLGEGYGAVLAAHRPPRGTRVCCALGLRPQLRIARDRALSAARTRI